MKGLVIWVAGLLAIASSACAADYTDPLPRFERAGNGFACHVDKGDGEKTAAMHWQADQACMRIGPLYVGMARTDLEKILGAPATMVVEDGHENFAYIVNRGDSDFVATYAVVIYGDDATTTSIQLTGKAFPNPWFFSGLTLGNSEDALRARLGAPLHIEQSDEAETLVWGYQPWTFSVEVHDKEISSIRVWIEIQKAPLPKNGI